MVRDLADRISECADGDEALAAYAAAHPDWVLMDIEMKRMNGIQIKLRPHCGPIPNRAEMVKNVAKVKRSTKNAKAARRAKAGVMAASVVAAAAADVAAVAAEDVAKRVHNQNRPPVSVKQSQAGGAL